MLSLGLLGLLDVGASAAICGTTVWFFFIQSPFLFKRLGRAKFVPIMMQITQLYFDTMTIACTAVLGMSYARAGLELDSMAAAAAWACVMVNRFVIVPRALDAGRRTTKERNESEDSKDVANFVSHGGSGSESGTKVYHRLVVVGTLAMVAGLVAHMALV